MVKQKLLNKSCWILVESVSFLWLTYSALVVTQVLQNAWRPTIVKCCQFTVEHIGSSKCPSCSSSSMWKNLTPISQFCTTSLPIVLCEKQLSTTYKPSLMDPILQLKKAVHTRWLSHDQAITVLQCTISSVITTLEREVTENDKAVACGLAREIKTYNFIATVYLLSDVFPLYLPNWILSFKQLMLTYTLLSLKCQLQLHHWSHFAIIRELFCNN